MIVSSLLSVCLSSPPLSLLPSLFPTLPALPPSGLIFSPSSSSEWCQSSPHFNTKFHSLISVLKPLKQPYWLTVNSCTYIYLAATFSCIFTFLHSPKTLLSSRDSMLLGIHWTCGFFTCLYLSVSNSSFLELSFPLSLSEKFLLTL